MTANGPARFDPALTRAAPRGLDVLTTLVDLAIVTYAVEPQALARHLAPGVEPELRRLDDGREVALVSAVPFRDLDFRFAKAPWLRFRMGQTNYRAYVWHAGRRAAWFFGTSLTRPFHLVPRHAWRLPWHPARMRFEVCWLGERCTRYRMTTSSKWAACELELEGSDVAMGRLDGFADAEETAVILTHPLVGLFRRTDGRSGTYSVWHDKLLLQRGSARVARFALLERLGLISADAVPHSVLLQRACEFEIRLPPRLVPG